MAFDGNALAHARSRIGTSVLERYRFEALIGHGGLGVVYRALDCFTGEAVAIKVMHERLLRVRTAAARFLREARIAQALDHPAIPRGLAAGMDRAGAPLLVMQHVAGRDFAHILANAGPLAVRDAVLLGARVASALDTAHRSGVIHRDVKPANLMLRDGAGIPDGVVVLDFSIAFSLDEPRLSTVNSYVGSPEYMSPEQARGEPGSPSSDLYSLGATLFHLLSGQTLFHGGALDQLAYHASAPVPSLRARRPEVSPDLERLLTAMLDKEPGRRPSSAGDVATALASLADERAGTSRAWLFSTGGAIAEQDEPHDARQQLIEQVHALTAQLHDLTRTSRAGEAKLVQELVEISARNIERAALQNERIDLEADGASATEIDAVQARIAAMGDGMNDLPRESLLESILARMQARSLAQQNEILARIAELQREIAAGSGE